MIIAAWLVIDGHGRRSVHLDQAHALAVAAQQHGIVHQLVEMSDAERWLAAELERRSRALTKENPSCRPFHSSSGY